MNRSDENAGGTGPEARPSRQKRRFPHRRSRSKIVGALVAAALAVLGYALVGQLDKRARSGQGDGVGLPKLPDPEPGVVRVVAKNMKPMLPLTRHAAGLRLSVTACRVRAPGQWVVEGQVGLPDGVRRARLGITVDLVLSGTLERLAERELEILGSGTFAFSFDERQEEAPRAFKNPKNPGAIPTWFDKGEKCALSIWSADAPIADESATGPVFHTSTPLSWKAPSGSLDALGIGARMDRLEDPRRVWAYFTWFNVALPFDRLWVPNPESGIHVRGVGGSVTKGDPCKTVSLSLSIGSLTQYKDCERVLDLMVFPGVRGPERVEGAPGFRWAQHGSGWPSALRLQNGTLLEATAPTREQAAAIARVLRPYRNLRILPVPPSPRLGRDRGQVISRVLHNMRLKERARFRYLDGLALVGTGLGPDGKHRYVLLFVHPYSQGWFASGARQRWDGCLMQSGAGSRRESYALVIAGDPAATIEWWNGTRWVGVPTTKGAAFITPLDRDLSYRAVDPRGSPLTC